LLPGAVQEIKQWALRASTLEARYSAIKRFGYFKCSPLGTFQAMSEAEYAKIVKALFAEWVAPLPSLPEPTERIELVFNKLRRQLDNLKVLTNRPDEVDYGMVMPRFPLDSQSRIFVDYAYRSADGLNLIETVNLAAPVDRLKKILVYKAFVLEHAKRQLPGNVFASLVYEGGTLNQVGGMVLDAVSRCTDEMINLDNENESLKLLTKIKLEATPNRSFTFH